MTEEKKDIFLSIIIIASKFSYKILWTLNSIFEQIEEDFEVIIVESKFSQFDEATLKEHYKNETKLFQYHSKKNKRTYMMNKCLKVAQGKYVQFMFEGNVYLSKYSIFYLTNFTQTMKNPDLVFTSYVSRKPAEPIRITTKFFSLKRFLKTGQTYFKIHSSFFLRKVLIEVGGFDENYELRQDLDVILKICKDKKNKISFLKRVLVDYDYFQKNTNENIIYGKDTIKILYKNAGVIKTIFWVILHSQLKILKIWKKKLKAILYKPC